MIIIAFSVFTPLFSHVVAFGLSAFSSLSLEKPSTEPSIIVVLGGGLSKYTVYDNDHHRTIIELNHFSQSRADSTLNLYNNTPTKPIIITSGVESPWLVDYLQSQSRSFVHIISDNASMNTCENAIFTNELLTHHHLPKIIYLVTDRYHMARARRQFAKVGVQTLAYNAPLSKPITWLDPKANLIHSRRAIYEVVALIRDITKPQDNCRRADEITIQQINTPRRVLKTF
ncbi:YdcF family protein [Moraxella nasovis]|uniref:YdcF family protein n=1 Tax=Moraxella nasovis TaxID=2904121 RepID=UPI001F60FE9E|nr:YdcF family protein [Moraxella nasovis]UNU72965.1 YdcF family protein [Moraxella nasovis]